MSASLRQWKAHDGLIVVVDWSPRNNYIISGGEDKKYKVLTYVHTRTGVCVLSGCVFTTVYAHTHEGLG